MRQAACILLLREDGKLLAASRRGEPENVNLVGGKVDKGEKVHEAALREFHEETGVKLYPDFLVEVYKRPCLGPTDYECTTFLTFQKFDQAAQAIDPDNPFSPEEGIEIKWITWDAPILRLPKSQK
jgi:8-oxo-dGTP pyrophosphatase MutT (NUDIX family)